jgi:hypothetical protein
VLDDAPARDEGPGAVGRPGGGQDPAAHVGLPEGGEPVERAGCMVDYLDRR